MRTIIGLCGYAGCGKDALAAKMQEYRRVAFADSLKLECKDMLKAVGLEPDLFGEDKAFWRDLLIFWGRKRRELDKDYWLKKVVFEILRNPDERFIITDIRYPNEAKWVLDHEGLVIRIERPGYKAASEEEATSIKCIDMLYELPIIRNDGSIDDLERVARSAINSSRNWKLL